MQFSLDRIVLIIEKQVTQSSKLCFYINANYLYLWGGIPRISSPTLHSKMQKIPLLSKMEICLSTRQLVQRYTLYQVHWPGNSATTPMIRINASPLHAGMALALQPGRFFRLWYLWPPSHSSTIPTTPTAQVVFVLLVMPPFPGDISDHWSLSYTMGYMNRTCTGYNTTHVISSRILHQHSTRDISQFVRHWQILLLFLEVHLLLYT